MRNSGKALWDSCCSTMEQKQETGALARSLSRGELVPQKGEGRGRSGGQAGGWLRWSAHPLGGAVCRDHVQDPAFAPGTSEVTIGFWPFCILLFIICPNCAFMYF